MLTLISLSSTHTCRTNRDKRPSSVSRFANEFDVKRIPKRSLPNENKKRLSREPNRLRPPVTYRMEVSVGIKISVLMAVRERGFETERRGRGDRSGREIRRSLIAGSSARRSVNSLD